MPNHINVNELLDGVEKRVTGKTQELIATEGQVLKIEASPDGEEMELGTVPAGKKWITSYVVYVEEVDA